MLNKKNIIGINRDLYQFTCKVGEVLSVKYEAKVGNLKTFTGICIGKKNQNINTKIILRNVIDNIGVEYDFFLYGTDIVQIKRLSVKKGINFQRSKLYYLRKQKLNMSKVS